MTDRPDLGIPLPDGWTPPPKPVRAGIEGRFIRLEPLVVAHAPDLHAANTHPGGTRNWDYLAYGPYQTEAEYAAWVGEMTREGDPMFYAIIDKGTGKAVGVASYLRINPGSGSIEVGHINFSPLLQRKPGATEAMYLMMKWVFEAGYRRYEWKCNALNQPSRNAAMRLGLSYEGVFRQATVSKGRNRDTAWYAAIDSEWPALDAAFQAWLDPANFDSDGHQQKRLSDLTGPILVNTG